MKTADKLTKTIMMIGIILLIITAYFGHASGFEMKFIISVVVVEWAILIFIRMYLVNRKTQKYTKMIENLNKILSEDNDIDEYIKKCDEYYNQTEDENFKEMLMINKSVGYSCACRYEEAIDTLKSVNTSALSEAQRAVVINNIAQFNFFIDREDEAMSVISDNWELLQKGLKDKSFMAVFNVTFSYYYCFKGDKQRAEQLCDEVISAIERSQSSTAGDLFIREKLEQLREKIEMMESSVLEVLEACDEEPEDIAEVIDAEFEVLDNNAE